MTTGRINRYAKVCSPIRELLSQPPRRRSALGGTADPTVALIDLHPHPPPSRRKRGSRPRGARARLGVPRGNPGRSDGFGQARLQCDSLEGSIAIRLSHCPEPSLNPRSPSVARTLPCWPRRRLVG